MKRQDKLVDGSCVVRCIRIRLPVGLLVSCAVNDQQQPAAGSDHSEQFRVVRQVALPMVSSVQIVNSQTAKKIFQKKGVQGWLDETGAWHMEMEVHHGRLRCATYETGIQFGRGNPTCDDVEWLTGVKYVTRLRRCNSASRLHTGSGEFSATANRFNAVSCVRVLARCEGTR